MHAEIELDYTIPRTEIMEQFEKKLPIYKPIYFVPLSEKYSYKSKVAVYQVTLRDGRVFVLKSIRVNSENKSKMERLDREYYIGKALSFFCKNVAKPIDMKQKIVDNGKTIFIEMIIEHGGLNLEQFFMHSPNLSISKLQEIQFIQAFYQLICALELMEVLGMSHLDLKPQNIVWDSAKSQLKIIDFGASISLHNFPDKITDKIGELSNRITAFTKLYAPPELLAKPVLKNEIVPQKFDVFSFGITFVQVMLIMKSYEDYEDILKFDRDSSEKSLKKLVEKAEKCFIKIGEELWLDFFKECIQYIPSKRPKFTEVKANFLKIAQPKIEYFIKFGSIKSIDFSTTYADINQKMIADTYYSLKQFRAAIWHYKKWESGVNENAEISKNDLIDTYAKLSDACSSLDFHVEANSYAEKALKIIAKLPQTDALKLDSFYERIGLAYIRMNKFKTAIFYLNQAKEIKEINCTDISFIYSALGVAYCSLNEFGESLDYYVKSIESTRKKPPIDKISNISIKETPMDLTIFNLPIILKRITIFFGKSQNSSKSLLFTEEEGLPQEIIEHPELVEICVHIGATYYNWFQNESNTEYANQAKYYWEKAKSVYTKILGEYHPNLASLYCYLGMINAIFADYDISIEYYNKGIEISRKVLGEDHPDLALAYERAANTYKSLDKHDLNLEFLKKAIEIKEKIYSLSSKNLIDSYEELASVYCTLKKFNEAIEISKKTVEIAKEKVGTENHSMVAWKYQLLGQTYCPASMPMEAIQAFEKSKDIWRIINGSSEPQIKILNQMIDTVYELFNLPKNNKQNDQIIIEKK